MKGDINEVVLQWVYIAAPIIAVVIIGAVVVVAVMIVKSH